METRNPADTLRQLVEGDAKKKAAAQIRALIDQIEDTASAGVPLQAIWEALKADGINTSFPYFKNVLYRVRKERKEQGATQNKKTSHSKENDASGSTEKVIPKNDLAKKFHENTGATKPSFEHSAKPPKSDDLI